LVRFFVSVMESATHVCQTCGLQFASDKARKMHAVRVHVESIQSTVNAGKHILFLWLRISVDRTLLIFLMYFAINVLKC